jgi:16S rRNA A1518/A1519 N6-dimethyltransferase RsmA/KsgA/DIM1 with predicted DNA glycosylase/AP lyase activity
MTLVQFKIHIYRQNLRLIKKKNPKHHLAQKQFEQLLQIWFRKKEKTTTMLELYKMYNGRQK